MPSRSRRVANGSRPQQYTIVKAYFVVLIDPNESFVLARKHQHEFGRAIETKSIGSFVCVYVVPKMRDAQTLSDEPGNLGTWSR